MKLDKKSLDLLDEVFEKWIINKKNYSISFISDEKLFLLKKLAVDNFINLVTNKNINSCFYQNNKYKKNQYAEITNEGLNFLRNRRILSKKWNNPHDQILYRCMSELSKDENVYCFSDFELNNNRPDIFMIRKRDSFDQMQPVVFEIKHSRNDFFNDIKKPEKREAYLKYCEKMYYVCETELIKKEEVPNECGLIYINTLNEMTIIKEAPPKNLIDLEEKDLTELLMTLVLRTEPDDIKVQISVNNRDCFQKEICDKYVARNYKNSLVITREYQNMLNQINGDGYLKINVFNKKIIGDLFFWNLIDHDNKGFLNKTKKGIQILEEISKRKRKIRENWCDNVKYLHDGEIAIMKNVKYEDNTIPLVTIPYSKKHYNIKLNAYYPIKKQEEIPHIIKEIEKEKSGCFSRCFLLINDDIIINKKEIPKDIGVMLKKTNNNYNYVELIKRAKENKSVKLVSDIIIKRLLDNIQNENIKYMLFF